MLAKQRTGVYSFSRTGNSHALETPAGEPKMFPKDKHPHYAWDWALADTSSLGRHFGTGPSEGSRRSPGPIHPWGGIGHRSTTPALRQSLLSPFRAFLIVLSDSSKKGPACAVHRPVERQAALCPPGTEWEVQGRHSSPLPRRCFG